MVTREEVIGVFRQFTLIQLCLALTPRWKKCCICHAYPWIHHRGIGKCKPAPPPEVMHHSV